MEQQWVELVEVELDDGSAMLAEAISLGGGDVAASGGRLRLSETRHALGEMARWALHSVRESVDEPPDRLDIEFGMKLAVKSGRLIGVIAESGGEASLVVRMGWDRSAREPAAAAEVAQRTARGEGESG